MFIKMNNSSSHNAYTNIQCRCVPHAVHVSWTAGLSLQSPGLSERKHPHPISHTERPCYASSMFSVCVSQDTSRKQNQQDREWATKKQISYGELASVSMEAEHFQDLKSARRPRSAVPVQLWSPRIRRADREHSHLTFSRFQTQEGPRFQLSATLKAGAYQRPSSEPARQEGFSLTQPFCSQEVSRADEARPHHGGQAAPLHPLTQMLVSVMNLTNASQLSSDPMSRHLVAHPGWHMKWTIKPTSQACPSLVPPTSASSRADPHPILAWSVLLPLVSTGLLEVPSGKSVC